MFQITEFIEYLKKEKTIYIQCHNFPDHDAVASAFGMQNLLKHYGIDARITYKGEIQRGSLLAMEKSLGIETTDMSNIEFNSDDKIIIVDGCKYNSNVDDLPGDEIAVIDHHEVEHPENVEFVDIRPTCGACSTIIASYYMELGVEMPQNVATALMIGLNMDTALLTRKVSEEDIKTYPYLYMRANVSMVNSILRNYIQTKDLQFFRYVLDNIKIKDRYTFCYFQNGCNQNLLGILGDFLLSLEEVEFVVLCANNGSAVNLSVRSENPALNAGKLIQEVLKDWGFGGGHADMAGGVIKNLEGFQAEVLDQRFHEMIIKYNGIA